jgi:uncharacterized protein
MNPWLRRLQRRGVLVSVFAPMRFVWLRAVRSPVSTRDLAMGFAIGVFWACIPIFILHWPCAVATAAVMKRSKIAASAAVFISNPFVVPVQYSAAWFIGRVLLGDKAGGSVGFSEGESVLATVMQMGWVDVAALELGGFAMGVVLCAPAYFVAFGLADRLRGARKSSTNASVVHNSTED